MGAMKGAMAEIIAPFIASTTYIPKLGTEIL